MHPTLPQADAIAPQRQLVCGICWGPIGRPCTVSGLPGDHLGRWMQAEKAGLLSRDDLAAVIAEAVVITSRVIIPERGRAA